MSNDSGIGANEPERYTPTTADALAPGMTVRLPFVAHAEPIDANGVGSPSVEFPEGSVWYVRERDQSSVTLRAFLAPPPAPGRAALGHGEYSCLITNMNAALEVLKPSDLDEDEGNTPEYCPFCGDTTLHTYLNKWPATSDSGISSESDISCTLNEHQCGGCGLPFWT